MFKKSTQSPKERFMNALFNMPVDRTPVGNPTSVATIESMKSCDAFFPEVHLEPDKMARLASTGFEILRFDTISPYFSVQQEAAALGCDVDWGNINTMPALKKVKYSIHDEIIIPNDFLEHPATSVITEALAILKKEYQDHVCLVGKVMGPWTLAYHLFGVQELLIATIKEPIRVKELLKQLEVITLLFAEAQFQAGADVVTLADHITGDLVGPKAYRDFLLPIHQDINIKINKPLILHICGKTLDRIDYISKAGFAAFHIDSKNDLIESIHIAKLCDLLLIGNINNTDILLNGDIEDVYNAVKCDLNAGIQIIAPECAVPLNTKNDNLKAIVDAVQIYQSKN